METNGTVEKNLLWYTRTKTCGHRFLLISDEAWVSDMAHSLNCHAFNGDIKEEYVKGRIERDSGTVFYVGVCINKKGLVDESSRPIYDFIIYHTDVEEELPTPNGMNKIVKMLQHIHTDINDKDYGDSYQVSVTAKIREDVMGHPLLENSIAVEAGVSKGWVERPVLDLRTKKENKVSENTSTINTAVETPVAAKTSLWSRFLGFVKGTGGVTRKLAIGLLVAPTIVGLVGLGLGLIATAGPSILGNILKGWLGRGVGTACKVLIGVGAVVAGFFGSWLVCGWLALNALAV